MEQSVQMQYLGQEKISRLLLKFSIPCILSLLVSALYNIVDQIFIGNSELGYLGNAATGIVFPILIITQAFAWCFGDGSAAYLSICQGKKDTQNAHKCIGTAITMTFIVSVAMLVLCFLFEEPLLRLFGASDNTVGLAMDYFNVLLPFFPFYMISNMMNAVIRADGSPAFSMASMTAGAVVNIILDPVFIFGLRWGMAGAAWATVIGQTVSFAISVVYFFRTKSFRLTKNSFLPRFNIFSNAVTLGASSFITQMSIVVLSLVCNIMLFRYGSMSVYGADIPISVISVETKVFTIVINIVVGIILGGQPILGYNVGAKKFDRVKRTYKTILLATVVVAAVSTLVFEISPQLVIGIFGGRDNPLYMEFAVKTFRIFLSLVTFTCIIKMTSIFFQAVGKPLRAVVASLTRDIICFVPLVIFLPRIFEANAAGTGVTGILFAAPAADFIGMLVVLAMTVPYFRTLGVEKKKSSPYAATAIAPSKQGIIVTISREHGSAGKEIGRVIAKTLDIPFYYKEVTALAAQESGLDQAFISELNANSPTRLHDLYLSTNVIQQAVVAQAQIIRKIAKQGACVIIGRAADNVLHDYDNVVRVFIHAPKEYRMNKVMEMYGDTKSEAEKNIRHADEARAAYYKNIAGNDWGVAQNYDLCVDSSVGVEQTAKLVCDYIQCRQPA